MWKDASSNCAAWRKTALARIFRLTNQWLRPFVGDWPEERVGRAQVVQVRQQRPISQAL